jgi:hypothetical protein
MLHVKSWLKRVSSRSSRVLVLTFSVVLLVLVCSPSTIKLSSSCSARSSKVDPDRQLHWRWSERGEGVDNGVLEGKVLEVGEGMVQE